MSRNANWIFQRPKKLQHLNESLGDLKANWLNQQFNYYEYYTQFFFYKDYSISTVLYLYKYYSICKKKKKKPVCNIYSS